MLNINNTIHWGDHGKTTALIQSTILLKWFMEQNVVTKVVIGKYFQKKYLGKTLREAQQERVKSV